MPALLTPQSFYGAVQEYLQSVAYSSSKSPSVRHDSSNSSPATSSIRQNDVNTQRSNSSLSQRVQKRLRQDTLQDRSSSQLGIGDLSRSGRSPAADNLALARDALWSMYEQRNAKALKELLEKMLEFDEEEGRSDREDYDERQQRRYEYDLRVWVPEYARQEMDLLAIEAVLRRDEKWEHDDALKVVEDAKLEFETRTRLNAVGYTEEQIETMIMLERPTEKEKGTYANGNAERSGVPGVVSSVKMKNMSGIKGPERAHYTISRDATWCDVNVPEIADDIDESDSSEDDPEPTTNVMPPETASM